MKIHWNKRKPLRKKRVGLEQQHGCRFIALKHQYRCHNAIWKRSLGGDDSKKTQSFCFPTCRDWNLCFSFRVEWKYSFVPIPRNRYLQTSRPIGVKARHSPSYWRMDKKTKGSAAWIDTFSSHVNECLRKRQSGNNTSFWSNCVKIHPHESESSSSSLSLLSSSAAAALSSSSSSFRSKDGTAS